MRAKARILRPDFARAGSKREDSRAHLNMVKQLPCVICGKHGVDPHHLKRGVDSMPKGVGRTHEDKWAIPACRRCHDQIENSGNDDVWLAERGIDGRGLARSLWEHRGDLPAMARVMYNLQARRSLAKMGALSGRF